MNIDERIEALHVNIESLHSSVSELYASVSQLRLTSERDGENIRALARVAEMHERRLTEIEGDSNNH